MKYGIARGLSNNSPTKLLAYDTFLQAGELKGKALPLGPGTWGAAGDAQGFNLNEVGDTALRTATSDADLYTGHYAIAGSEEPTTTKVSAESWGDAVTLESEKWARGVFARYTNTSNWVMAYLTSMGFSKGVYLRVVKRVAGTVTILDEAYVGVLGIMLDRMVVDLSVDANGVTRAWAYAPGTQNPIHLIETYDSVLATGGSLAKGKAGMYDAWLLAGANNREFDNFNLLQGDAAGRVCFSGRNCRITSDGFTRDDAEGKYEGQASLYRGANLFLPPGVNRLALALRRNDVEAETNANVTDKHTITITARERFLVPRG